MGLKKGIHAETIGQKIDLTIQPLLYSEAQRALDSANVGGATVLTPARTGKLIDSSKVSPRGYYLVQFGWYTDYAGQINEGKTSSGKKVKRWTRGGSGAGYAEAALSYIQSNNLEERIANDIAEMF